MNLTILGKLTDEKAQKEVKQFSLWGLIIALVTFFIFWPLAVAGLAFGGRAFLLTYHKGNKNRKDLTALRAMSGIAALLSAATLVLNIY